MGELLRSRTRFLPTEKRVRAKEIRNVLIRVRYPRREPRVSDKYCFPERFREQYSIDFLDKYVRTGTLYERIFEHGSSKLDQMQKIVEKFNENWYSRQAVLSIWIAERDLFSSFPPCLCLAQAMIRGKRLYLTAYFRSNDAWLSALPDMIALANLQKELASRMQLRVGEYAHFANSYHIYEFDYPMAKEVFA